MRRLLIGVLMTAVTLSASTQILADTAEQNSPLQQGQTTTAPQLDQAVLQYYIGHMTRKIKTHIKLNSCQVSNKEVGVEMQLAQSGYIFEILKLVQSSGDSKCDEDTLKAILKAQPFDLPHDHPEELKVLLEKISIKLGPRPDL